MHSGPQGPLNLYPCHQAQLYGAVQARSRASFHAFMTYRPVHPSAIGCKGWEGISPSPFSSEGLGQASSLSLMPSGLALLLSGVSSTMLPEPRQGQGQLSTVSQTAVYIRDIFMASGNNMGLGHQHRPRLP